MGHYASEMGYVSQYEKHRERLIAEGRCLNCEGYGYVDARDVSGYNHRALCFDCRGAGSTSEEK